MSIFSRFVWNFFRLENEHLNNCGQFRAVRDISIGPIDSNVEQQLIDIMDDEDGTEWRIRHRRLPAKYVSDFGDFLMCCCFVFMERCECTIICV